MKNDESFFANVDCKYYPCHNGIDEINCLFCYCPLNHMECCPGTYIRLASGIKDCTSCTFPHKRENYEKIINILSG